VRFIQQFFNVSRETAERTATNDCPFRFGLGVKEKDMV